ncbi:hypothetical protein GF351_02340, partial [Candidatus Woesearchaeota archaeon]|nr:hypothetical protein [Candidatus Woesearchaeota archaeon]
MTDEGLVQYLKTYINQGYDKETLRQHLIRYGYDPSDVDSAISSAIGAGAAAAEKAKPAEAKVPSRGIKGIPVPMIAGGAALLIVAAVVVAIVALLPGDGDVPEQLLDISTTKITSEPRVGDIVSFNMDLMNTGGRKRYDVLINHVLTTKGRVISEKEETVAIETRVAKPSSIEIPKSSPAGRYQLRTTAKYNGLEAVATLTFDVLPPLTQVTVKQCPESCDDGDPCTRDFCDDQTKECIHEPIVPCCGDNVCEVGENELTCPADCRQQAQRNVTVKLPEQKLKIVLEGAVDAAEQGAEAAGKYCQ